MLGIDKRTNDLYVFINFQARLSADAKSFIPSHLKDADGVNGSLPTGNAVGVLPKYMTNCYPFVLNDPAQRQR